MEAGCSPDVESMIEKLTLARELWTLLSEEDSGKFFPCLLEHCFAHCVPLLPEGKLTILLIDEEGIFLQDTITDYLDAAAKRKLI